MQLLMTLLPIVFLVSFGAYVWLLVMAFRQSALWGLAVFFLSPISAIIFAIQFWEEAKKPFLIYVGSWVGAILILVASFASIGGEMMAMAEQMEQAAPDQGGGFLDSAERGAEPHSEVPVDDLLQQAREAADAKAALSSLTVVPEPASPPAFEFPAVPETLSFDEAHRLVGQFVRVQGSGGQEFEGKLTRAEEDSLFLETHLSSGTFAFELERAEVESVEGMFVR